MNALIELFGDAQQALFECLLQPLMFHLGLGNLLAEGYRATGWLLVGVLEIAIMLTLMRALERWRPAEPVTDRASVRTDIVYTLIHRLGLFRVLMFFSIDPLWDWAVGQLRLQGLPSFELDALWPGVTDLALVSPAYHRLHHAIGVGHESAGQGSLGGHNFAVLFPVWDMIFRTARFDTTPLPTGIRDQLAGRDYGHGFWAQQWLGLKRLAGRPRA